MNQDQLAEILAAHAAWLRGNGGAGADLSGAYLADANLAGANLAGADLTDANLAGADLTRANLTDATGIVCAGTDPRGFRFLGVSHAAGPRVAAGCRWFTIAEAKVHWANNRDALARVRMIEEMMA